MSAGLVSSTQLDPRAPFCVVLNAAAGDEDARERIETIESTMSAAGRPCELLRVEDPGQLTQVTARAIASAHKNGGVVVAAGGDGTLSAVVQQVLPTGLPFGVLPQGTFNYFAREHGIPGDTAQALQVLLSAQIKPVQVGMLNDRYFIVNASMGFYPELLEDREAFKQRLGRSRSVALLAGLATLLKQHRSWAVKLTQDDHEHAARTSTLFVGNNRLQLEQIGIDQAPALDAGRMVAVMVKPMGKLAMLGLLARGALGQLGDADQVDSFAFSTLSVLPRWPYKPGRLKVAMDGEVAWMRAPLEFRVAPKSLRLLVAS